MIDSAVLLSDVLLTGAEAAPDAVAYETVGPDGTATVLTRAALAARASVLADRLAACPEGPVLLLYPAGFDYVVAVLAAFLAGRPVVPAYPPGPSSSPDHARLDGIVDDARPSVVLAPQAHPGIPAVPVLAVPGAEADGIPWRRAATTAAQDVAIIQYTSGSTGRPRGVLVRHESLAANTAAIADRMGFDASSRGLTWLPPFHDMGLIGGLLTPLAAGIPVRIMAPQNFLKGPLNWLRQITESGATVSGGPNFAYDLCVRRARTDAALEGLDLSGWRAAFNGGETVKQSTLTAFATRFAPVGFDPRAFLPCYGLAEATLIVSAGRWAGPVPPTTTSTSTAGTVETAVSCGTPVPGQRVVVVDPDRAVPCPDGEEGEIWVAGRHVTPGYFSGEAAGLFGELGGERFLRTGDRGRLCGGELHVTGRTKDIIVFRGVNHHAVDVEAAALDAAGRSGGAAAAFLVDDGPDPYAVLVMEVRGRVDDGLAGSIRAAVLERTRLPLALVALVPPRSVPRTSSGKVRRSDCRTAFLDGAYAGAGTSSDGTPAEVRARSAATSGLTTVICGIVAEVCGLHDCRPSDGLAGTGLDSVRAAEVAAILQDALGFDVPLEAVLGARSPQAVSDALMASWLTDRTAIAIRDRLGALTDDEGAA